LITLYYDRVQSKPGKPEKGANFQKKSGKTGKARE